MAAQLSPEKPSTLATITLKKPPNPTTLNTVNGDAKSTFITSTKKDKATKASTSKQPKATTVKDTKDDGFSASKTGTNPVFVKTDHISTTKLESLSTSSLLFSLDLSETTRLFTSISTFSTKTTPAASDPATSALSLPEPTKAPVPGEIDGITVKHRELRPGYLKVIIIAGPVVGCFLLTYLGFILFRRRRQIKRCILATIGLFTYWSLFNPAKDRKEPSISPKSSPKVHQKAWSRSAEDVGNANNHSQSANDDITLVNSSGPSSSVVDQKNKKPQLNHSPSHGRFSFESSSPPRRYHMTCKETQIGSSSEYTLATTRTNSSLSFCGKASTPASVNDDCNTHLWAGNAVSSQEKSTVGNNGYKRTSNTEADVSDDSQDFEDLFFAEAQNGKAQGENGRESRMTAFYSCGSTNAGLQAYINGRKSVDEEESLSFEPLTEEECVMDDTFFHLKARGNAHKEASQEDVFEKVDLGDASEAKKAVVFGEDTSISLWNDSIHHGKAFV